VTVVKFEGGLRGGEVDGSQHLAGVDQVWFTEVERPGVYRRSDPLRIEWTPFGDAEIWVAQV
jgi:hypothetical protein